MEGAVGTRGLFERELDFGVSYWLHGGGIGLGVRRAEVFGSGFFCMERAMKKQWTVLAAAVMGMAVVGCSQMKKDEGEHEDAEVKVAFAQLPAAVQATLTKEAGGAAIKEADEEEKDGKKVYEADVMIGGKNMEVVVAADGTLVSKKEDNEAAEGAKKDTDKEEKEETGDKKN